MKRLAFLLILLCSLSLAQPRHANNRLEIGPGDLLTLEVFDVPELKQELRVNDFGDVEIALLGKLHLASLTVEEAGQLIGARLEQKQLVLDAHVSLLVREYATQGVAVSGEVRKPGIYQVLGPRTLMQVVSEAGGFTEIASPRVTVRHPSGEVQSVLVDQSGEVLLHSGDTVNVPRAGIAYIVGDVPRSGGYVMQDHGELSIAQLVSLGGGLLPTARGGKARLVRKTPSGHTELEINVNDVLRGRAPDLSLQADDILFIPNSTWKSAATRMQNITQLTVGAAIYSSLN